MDLLDRINETMNLLKQQTIDLKEKEAEIEQYKQMLQTGHQSIGNSEFLISSTETDDDAVNIVLANFDEFGSSAYDHGFRLTARYECDRNHNIYLSALQEEANLTEMTKIIDGLVEKKRQNILETREIPCFRTGPQTRYLTLLIEKNNEKLEQQANRLHEQLMKQLLDMKMNDDNMVVENKKLQEKVEDCERIIKHQEHRIEDCSKKIEEMESSIKEETKKIAENEQKLKKGEEEMEKQIRQQVFIPLLHSKPDFLLFLEDKNFEVIKKSTVVMDELVNRLFKGEKGDFLDPPLKEINSLEKRRKEVFDFIDFEKYNWNKYYSGTDIQKKIHDWLWYNKLQFLYNPSEEEKESSRKMFSNKFKLENTIGTIHFLSIQFSDRTEYFCFAISYYRIVCWSESMVQQKAYSFLHKDLKKSRSWRENSKFATELEVNNKQSDILIHTSNKDVFVENEKVVTWIKNNFNMEQQNNTFELFTFFSIPPLFNLLINFYDTSFTG